MKVLESEQLASVCLPVPNSKTVGWIDLRILKCIAFQQKFRLYLFFFINEKQQVEYLFYINLNF